MVSKSLVRLIALVAVAVLAFATTAVAAPSRPANDTFRSPQVVTVGDTVTNFEPFGATTHGPEPQPDCNGAGETVWFSVTATTTGNITVDTAGSNYDTVLAVFTWAGGKRFSEIVCSDDVGGGDTTSRVGIGAFSGVTYLIEVGQCCSSNAAGDPGDRLNLAVS
jgi:hypothetical protein